MNYITVDKSDLSIEIINGFPENGFVIPTKFEKPLRDLAPLENILYYQVLHPAECKADHTKSASRVRIRGQEFINLEPWIIVVAHIMWQGIMQGLAWDTIKIAVKKAIQKLSTAGFAPKERIKRKKTIKTQIGFSWAKYGTDGEKQYEMFLGLKRVFEKISKERRQEIAESRVLGKRVNS